MEASGLEPDLGSLSGRQDDLLPPKFFAVRPVGFFAGVHGTLYLSTLRRVCLVLFVVVSRNEHNYAILQPSQSIGCSDARAWSYACQEALVGFRRRE